MSPAQRVAECMAAMERISGILMSHERDCLPCMTELPCSTSRHLLEAMSALQCAAWRMERGK